MLTFRKACGNDIELLQSLACEIWMSYYPDIISVGQIEYMLDLMYSYKAIEYELQNSVVWEILEYGSESISYLSFTPYGNEIKLNKLYLKKEYQGKGFGRMALEHVIGYAEEYHFKQVYLTVNKTNTAQFKI